MITDERQVFPLGVDETEQQLKEATYETQAETQARIESNRLKLIHSQAQEKEDKRFTKLMIVLGASFCAYGALFSGLDEAIKAIFVDALRGGGLLACGYFWGKGSKKHG